MNALELLETLRNRALYGDNYNAGRVPPQARTDCKLGRKKNPYARPYQLSPEAKAQRRQAAIDRWNAMPDKAERREVLRPAFSITPGRPRITPPALKPRHAVRDRDTGRFVRAK